MGKIKATIMIEERLFKDSKRRALDHDKTFSAWVEEGLRLRNEERLDPMQGLYDFFAWADRERPRSIDGNPLTRDEAHER